MLRGPDGAWRVLADRTGQAQGLAYALENRRILSRVVPELFQSQRIQQLRPVPGGHQRRAAGARPGRRRRRRAAQRRPFRPAVVRARAAVARAVDRPGGGRRPDPAQRPGVPEDPARPAAHRRAAAPQGRPPRRLAGTVGRRRRARPARRDARRLRPHGQRPRLRAWPRRPALAAFLPTLARRLLGEDLQLASQATLWLGEGAVVRTVLRDLEGWVIRKATDGNTPPVVPMMLSAADRADLAARIAADPGRLCRLGRADPVASRRAPGEHGLDAKPIALRMFLTFDGTRWRAFPGGLARALSEEDALAGRLPRNALSKDVWVMAGRSQHGAGRARAADPDAGDPPHRRRPAVPRRRQFLLAGPLSGAAGGSRPAAARDHHPHPAPVADGARRSPRCRSWSPA